MKRLLAATMAICFTLLPPGTAQAAQESWYTYWGIGWASNSYSGEVGNVLESAKDDGLDHVSLSLDMLGFYWPLPGNPKTLLGFVVNGTGDRYDGGKDDWVQVNSYILGVSSMHFFGREPGAGFFIRADLGMAVFSVSSSGDDSENSDIGYGGLIGGGYGIPVSEGTRILININYAYKHAAGDTVGSLGISVGGLF